MVSPELSKFYCSLYISCNLINTLFSLAVVRKRRIGIGVNLFGQNAGGDGMVDYPLQDGQAIIQLGRVGTLPAILIHSRYLGYVSH